MTEEYDYKDGKFVLRRTSMMNATGGIKSPVARTVVKVALLGTIVFLVYKFIVKKKV